MSQLRHSVPQPLAEILAARLVDLGGSDKPGADWTPNLTLAKTLVAYQSWADPQWRGARIGPFELPAASGWLATCICPDSSLALFQDWDRLDWWGLASAVNPYLTDEDADDFDTARQIGHHRRAQEGYCDHPWCRAVTAVVHYWELLENWSFSSEDFEDFDLPADRARLTIALRRNEDYVPYVLNLARQLRMKVEELRPAEGPSRGRPRKTLTN